VEEGRRLVFGRSEKKDLDAYLDRIWLIFTHQKVDIC